MKNFIFNSLSSELLKIKNTAALWLVVGGSLFIPLIMIIIQISYPEKTAAKNLSETFWMSFYNESWQSMAMFLLPMGIILVTSMLTQLEFKNNTWKQLFSSPQPLYFIFVAKMKVIFLLMLLFLLLFNIGIYVSVLIPALIFGKIPFPTDSIPVLTFLKSSALYFIDCLPIIALQYLISLRFKNFLVPVGVGFALIIASMFALSWKFGYTFPYIYSSLNYFQSSGTERTASEISFHWFAIGYFVVITFVNYLIFSNRTEKG